MVTAAPQDQWRLLDVQAEDTRLARIAHRRRTLPELQEVAALEQRLAGLETEVVQARTRAGDIDREVARAEAAVDQVRTRAARNRQRLETGQGSPKDLQGLQHELESLARRQSVLEDEELEVMERLETAQKEIAGLEADLASVAEGLREVGGRRDAALATLDDEQRQAEQARAAAAGGLPGELLALYARAADLGGGVGAARLHQRRCEGCHLELNTVDLNRIRAAAPDAVLNCEECGRILIRTAESGL